MAETAKIFPGFQQPEESGDGASSTDDPFTRQVMMRDETFLLKIALTTAETGTIRGYK
jgi:hypothetical protein